MGGGRVKTANLLWAASLLVAGACALLLAGARLSGMALPDPMVRAIALLDLIALPIIGYAMVRKLRPPAVIHFLLRAVFHDGWPPVWIFLPEDFQKRRRAAQMGAGDF